MRSFLAIDMPGPIRSVLSDLQGGLRTGRPVPPENLHLTLRFLDDQPETALSDLHDRLQAVTRPGFELSLEGLGTFGGSPPRALFAGVAQSGPLLSLHAGVARALRQAGIILPRARFHPHVTLARFPRQPDPAGHGAQALALARFLSCAAGFRSAPFRVRSFGLYQSRLTPQGAIHDALAVYPLTG